MAFPKPGSFPPFLVTSFRLHNPCDRGRRGRSAGSADLLYSSLLQRGGSEGNMEIQIGDPVGQHSTGVAWEGGKSEKAFQRDSLFGEVA